MTYEHATLVHTSTCNTLLYIRHMNTQHTGTHIHMHTQPIHAHLLISFIFDHLSVNYTHTPTHPYAPIITHLTPQKHAHAHTHA